MLRLNMVVLLLVFLTLLGCFFTACGDEKENNPVACTDGIDNDGDGITDFCDQDCGALPEFRKAYEACHKSDSGKNTADNDAEEDDSQADDGEEDDDESQADDDEEDDDESQADDDEDEEEDSQADDGDAEEEDNQEDDDDEEEQDSQADDGDDSPSDGDDAEEDDSPSDDDDAEEDDSQSDDDDTEQVIEIEPQDDVLNCKTAPDIDGELNETFWNFGTKVAKGVSGTPDNTVGFDACWDDAYLFVVVVVQDTSVCVGTQTSPWWYDSVEIYIDPDNSKTSCGEEPCYDDYDAQMVIKYHDGFSGESFGDTTTEDNRPRYNSTGQVTSYGYVIEVRIPWADMGIEPEPQTTIGFDLGINDDDEPCTGGDDSQSRDSELRWVGDDRNYLTTENFGELTLVAEVAGGSK